MLALNGDVGGFTIADASGTFVPATATIVGTDHIEVRGIASPKFVRYGWSRGPHCNVYNGDYLPLMPFRTDRRASDAAPLGSSASGDTIRG